MKRLLQCASLGIAAVDAGPQQGIKLTFHQGHPAVAAVLNGAQRELLAKRGPEEPDVLSRIQQALAELADAP